LRQGEDRKTTVEETKLLDIKVKEVKSSQRKQRDQLQKCLRHMDQISVEMLRTKNYVEKIRSG
jgi:hypothetical protein